MSDNVDKTLSKEEAIIEENNQIQVRKEKLKSHTAKNAGIGFLNNFKPSTESASLKSQYGEMDKARLEAIENKPVYKIAGRIMLRRIMGKASFITLQDGTGRIQSYIRKNDLPEGQYDDFKADWDLGDIVGVEGTLFKTNTGELSLHATNIQLLTKSLRPLPDKFHGLADKEMRYRQRYVDLITNEESRTIFQTRSKMIQYIRQYFNDQNYMEVETPMMHVIPGGASAKKFTTHHNALDMKLYLRVAPELHLKRLVVGGLDRVFEINRNFRNEGLSTRHSPEFTMIEFYQAYADYKDMMAITENLIRNMAQSVLGTTQLHYQGQDFDLSKPFLKISMFDAILHFNPTFTKEQLNDFNQAKALAEKMGIKIESHFGLGRIQTELFEETAEHQLIQPTFITDYPAEISPLARRNDENPFITDRFEFFLGGREIANGFSELNDSEDQAERFKAQVQSKDAGDDEAMFYDADYIRALEYGLPPTAGEGLGIDRLVMFFTNSASIRDVILFPHMRQE